MTLSRIPARNSGYSRFIRDLKGGDFNTILKYTTADGIEVSPFYTREDLPASSEPLFTHTDWEVCEEIEVGDAATANKQALNALENGATALRFILLQYTDLHLLLKDIGIEYIDVQFMADGYEGDFAGDLQVVLAQRNLGIEQVNIAVSCDPIAQLVRDGEWKVNRDEAIANFSRHLNETNGTRNVCVEGAIYHNAGATPAYELACMLAHANEYLNLSEGNAASVQVSVATGPDYFFEIAKLRALRKVFALLLDAYGIQRAVYIHAESAARNLTLYDEYNNLLRTTTEAMSATIGGCNSLRVKPFDEVYNTDNPFSCRLARNVQLILKAESYFDKMADVSAGSFFIETLTEEIAAKAWDYFREIEKSGGFLASLEQGIIQDTIAEFAANQQDKFDTGKDILVGTNKYPDPKQMMEGRLTRLFSDEEVDLVTSVQPLRPIRLSAGYEFERIGKRSI